MHWAALYPSLGLLNIIFSAFDTVAAVKAIFQSMNSPSQLGWPANGDDPCGQSWKGITCSGNRVTEMYISALHFISLDHNNC